MPNVLAKNKYLLTNFHANNYKGSHKAGFEGDHKVLEGHAETQ